MPLVQWIAWDINGVPFFFLYVDGWRIPRDIGRVLIKVGSYTNCVRGTQHMAPKRFNVERMMIRR